MHQGCALGEQPIQRRLQVGYLQREPKWATAAPARFDLINRFGVRFIKDLQRGLAQIVDDGPILIVGPELRRLNPSPCP